MKLIIYYFGFLLLNFSFSSFVEAENLSNTVYKIGILVSLSGHGADYGKAIQNGSSLAIDDYKDKLGFCKIVYEDSEYNTSKTVTAFHKMAADGINLIYVFGGPMAEALAPLAEAKKIPLITDGIDPKLTVGRDFIVRHSNTPIEYGAGLKDYLLKRGKKKIGIVKTENQFLNALVGGFVDSSKGELDTTIVANMVGDESDFRSILPRLLKGKYDTIGLFLFPGQLSSLARLFKGREKDYTFFGAEVIENKQEIQASLGVLEGAVYPNNLVSDEFRERYFSRFKNDNQIKFAGEGYDVISLVLKSICANETIPDGEESMKLLKSVKVREGVLGRTEYVETEGGDKYFKAPVYVMRASIDGFKAVE